MYQFNFNDIKLDKIFDSATPEILGSIYPNNKLINPDNEDNNCDYLIKQLYSYAPSKSIIQILYEIRETKFNDVFSNQDGPIDLITHNKNFTHCYQTIYQNKNEYEIIEDNKIKFELTQGHNIVEAIIVDDIKSIKSIKICNPENHCILFYSDKLDYNKKKEYIIHENYFSDKNIIKKEGILISDFNIPIMATIYQKIFMEIELSDMDFKEIKIINILCNLHLINLFQNQMFELDIQQGKFIIFGNGISIEHFTNDDNIPISTKYQKGILNPKLTKLFDNAHKESLNRRNLK